MRGERVRFVFVCAGFGGLKEGIIWLLCSFLISH
jgi:hypothetical protein